MEDEWAGYRERDALFANEQGQLIVGPYDSDFTVLIRWTDGRYKAEYGDDGD